MALRKKILIITTLLVGSISFAGDLVVQKKGRLPGPELKYKAESKVPTFDLVIKKTTNGKTELSRVKNIPRLNVGEEPLVKAGDIEQVKMPAEKAFREFNIQQRPPPMEIDISKWKPTNGTPLVSGTPPNKVILPVDANSKAPAFTKFTPIVVGTMIDPQPKTEKVEDIPAPEMKLLQALIFLEAKKDYPMALALFAELLGEESIRSEVTYHLGITAKALGLYSEYKFRLLNLVRGNDSIWKNKAVQSLAENAAEGDKELVGILDPYIEKLALEIKNADQYNLNRAKFYLDKSNLTKAFAGVDEILLDSPLYIDAMFLKSLILYKGNQMQESILAQQTVLKALEEKKDKSREDFQSIVALTLARLYFQTGSYKEAFDTYLKVSKTTPEWLQAMTEQAWSQILSEDYEGAAGNMFSLHSDFFKKAFNPESYVVRTVGYLNLCQYGDGAKVVYDFKKKYTPVLKQLQEYGDSHKESLDYYDTIKTWAKNPDLQTVNGLPREFIFALTQHPSFSQEQKMINSVEDQVGRMNKITINLIKSEKKALSAQNDARKKLIEIKKDYESTSSAESKSQLKEKYMAEERRMMNAKIEHYIAKKARNSIKDLRKDGLVRLDQEKKNFLDLAGKAIKNRYSTMVSKLNESLDQSEVLQYELYSGAGDHIRYQMAGGDINEKERKELKVEDGKSLNWEFKGELWADELGHYRSSLKNVCPPEEKISSNSH